MRQIVVDRGLKIIDAGIAAAPDARFCNLGEETFDQVHPRSAGRREVELEARGEGRLLGGIQRFSCTVLEINFNHVAMGRGGTRESRVLSPLRPASLS